MRWRSWRDVSGELCDKIPVQVNEKMTYEAEALPVKKVMKERIEVTEMRMLRGMCGVTRENNQKHKDRRNSKGGRSDFKKDTRSKAWMVLACNEKGCSKR